MFWWGRVNAIIAILAVVSGVIAVLNGAWAMLVVLWVLLIVLRIALNAVNALWTAIAGWPLFYDTQILPGRQPRRRAQDDDYEVIDDEDR